MEYFMTIPFIIKVLIAYLFVMMIYYGIRGTL